MFIITAKLSLRRLALGSAAVLLLCCGLFAVSRRPDVQPTAAAQSICVKGLHSNSDRVEYLTSLGWEVQEEPISCQELVIPSEFDETYAQYVALQSEQGFDLSKYAGKRVKRYTYHITNHPTGEDNVQVNLLLYRGTVVGGEVLSPQPDGLLHGLARPGQN